MTLYDDVAGERPARHLKDKELVWFDFDPTPFMAFISAADYGSDDELAARFATLERAAWACETYLAFAAPRRIMNTHPVERRDSDELLIDLDRKGNPVGLDFASRDCASG